MKKVWYTTTLFIAISVFFCNYPIVKVICLILILSQFMLLKEVVKKYGKAEEIDAKIQESQMEFNTKRNEQESILNNEKNKLQNELNTIRTKHELQVNELKKIKNDLEKEINLLTSKVDITLYNFSDYDALTSEDCKNKLSLLKIQEDDLIKQDKALSITSESSKKVINNKKKQIIRCFNAECDNILLNLTVKKIDTLRQKLTKSFENLNNIFSTDGISLNKELLEIKLEGLNLTYTYELKKEQEKEQQKAIKEQMIEEEKVRKEIERQKAKIEKDQTQCKNEMSKLMKYLQKSNNDIEKQLYLDKIKELEERINSLEVEKENVLEREANARAGYVYIISNIGSFGDNIYKIGMTRRLEPMDRVKELSSASVPFEFDVHAMIFSDDAPTLETALHKQFEKQSVNKVNLRKEFFKISLDEIETFVKDNFNNTVEFTKIPVAKQYRESLELEKVI